jgi:hypothetical protein
MIAVAAVATLAGGIALKANQLIGRYHTEISEGHAELIRPYGLFGYTGIERTVKEGSTTDVVRIKRRGKPEWRIYDGLLGRHDGIPDRTEIDRGDGVIRYDWQGLLPHFKKEYEISCEELADAVQRFQGYL